MKKTIQESEMTFGEFDKENLFHIEDSQIYKNLGSGIKTVEFIIKRSDNCITFIEAKASCPNAANINESNEKQTKFEEFYSSVTDKFIASLYIYLAAILNRFHNISEVGNALNSNDMQGTQIEFILVIKKADDIAWLAGPLAELKKRLLMVRKIWGIKVKVLNEELAERDGLICRA